MYANGWSFRCVTPDEFARAAEQVVADGYDALKMYPLARPLESSPHGNIQHVAGRRIDREAEDLAVAKVRAVRQVIGPKVDLMVDMSAELTTDAVIRLGQRFEEFNLFFLEEPVDPFDVEALKKVSDRVNLPIAVGERLYTRYGFRRVMELHAATCALASVGARRVTLLEQTALANGASRRSRSSSACTTQTRRTRVWPWASLPVFKDCSEIRSSAGHLRGVQRPRMDTLLAAMQPNVEWPNAMEGGYVYGHEGVRACWTRQWALIDPRVDPRGVQATPDGRIAVDVHQVVRDLSGARWRWDSTGGSCAKNGSSCPRSFGRRCWVSSPSAVLIAICDMRL